MPITVFGHPVSDVMAITSSEDAGFKLLLSAIVVTGTGKGIVFANLWSTVVSVRTVSGQGDTFYGAFPVPK